MYFATVTISKIIETHDRITRFGSRTEFSFIADNKPHYAVSVRGRPTIAVGMKITALLKEDSNWQTLRGWKNWGSGALVPDTRGEIIYCVTCSILAALSSIASLPGQSANRSTSLFIAGIFIVLALMLWVGHYNLLRDLRLLRRLTEPATGPAVNEGRPIH